MKITIKPFLYVLALIALIYLGLQLVDFFSYKSSQDKLAVSKAQATTNTLRGNLENLLKNIESTGQDLGAEFGNNALAKEDVKTLIKKASLAVPEIRGVTACYKPHAFLQQTRLFCPYYDKGKQSYVFVENSYDYTLKGKGTAWYTDVIQNGPTWSAPYYGAASGQWYVDYGVPFYYVDGPKKGQVRGMIGFSLEVGDFRNLVHSISVGKTGYAFLTAKNNTFITHPISDYVGTKSLDDSIKDEPNPELIQAYQAMKAGQSGHVEFVDKLSGKSALFYYDSLPVSGYRMGLFFTKSNLSGSQIAVNRRYIRLGLTFSFFLVILITLYFGRDDLDRREIEILSVLTSALLFANIFLVGALQHSLNVSLEETDSPPIVDMTSLGNFIDKQNEKADRHTLEKFTPVPVGIFIERLEFEDSYNVNIGGTVWQRYPLEAAKHAHIGFRFPQISPFAEAAYIQESYRETIKTKEDEDGYLLVGWEFRVTLRLNLKYEDFPFDKRHLDIEIAPLSAADHFIFVPDLSSYQFTNPDRKSGLSKKISLSGNRIVESYFNFTSHTYDTSFGYPSRSAFEDVPVLHYNIRLNRKLLNAFVTYLIPIFVSLCLIYILIFASAKTNDRQGIIESMAAFFFVLIFSHIDLRKDIVTADLIFIEYFYFITYLMIVLSTLNLVIYTKDKSKIFDYNGNQLYRAIYFPLFFSLVLIVMLVKFY